MIKFLKKYLKSEKKLILLTIFISIISSLLNLLYGYLSGLAISKVTEKIFSLAIIILLINLTIYVINNIFRKFRSILSSKAGLNVMENINYDLLAKVLKLPTKAFEEKTSGEYINRITNDSEDIVNSLESFLQILIKILTCFILFVYISFNSLLVALEVIIFLLIFYKITKIYNPYLKKIQKEIKKDNDIFVERVNETVRGIREIRALGISKNVLLEIKNVVKALFSKRSQTIKFEQDYNAITDSLSEILITMIYITCILEIFLGKSSITFLISMTYYVYNFMDLINSYTTFATIFQKLKVSINRIYEITNNKLYEDIQFGKYHNINIKGNIEFKNVSFNYHDNKQKVLKKFNLQVNNNSKIAIIGKSGQGKSTIFNLLLRFFDASNGSILIDGVEIKEYDEESLRKNISIIRQDPFLFNRTILENFHMINPKLSLSKIRTYFKKAEIDDYIMSLPHKYNTKIGEGGVNLSGGQKQRLAIARALSKDSKIILFDEATSALDNESQEKIISVINEISKDHTIITIAHRLSTIIDSDVIHIMENGNIIASGNHKKLLKENKIYQDLYKSES